MTVSSSLLKDEKVFDAIVVGAGVAGSVAAIELRKLGVSVLLIEKEKTHHHKVCGEFLSGESVEPFERLGIDFDSLGARTIQRVEMFSGKSRLKSKLPFVARGISRFLLDEKLIEIAKSRGVEVQRGEFVVDILETFDGAKNKVGESLTKNSMSKERWLFEIKTNVGQSYFCRQVFLANGKHELKKINSRKNFVSPSLLLRRKEAPEFVGFKRHLRLPKEIYSQLDEKIEFFIFEGGYAGLSQIENGLANFCFILDKKVMAENELNTGPMHERWPKILKFISGSRSSGLRSSNSVASNPNSVENFSNLGDLSSAAELKTQKYADEKVRKSSKKLSRLDEIFAYAQWQWTRPVAIASIPYGFVYENHLQRFFVLGDQFSVIPSLTGDGMSQALLTAKKSVEFYKKFQNGELRQTEAVRDYCNFVAPSFSKQVSAGQSIQKLFRSPKLAAIGFNLIKPFPWMVQYLVKRTRVALPMEGKDVC